MKEKSSILFNYLLLGLSVLLFLYFFNPIFFVKPFKTDKEVYRPGESVEVTVEYFSFYGIEYFFHSNLFCDGGKNYLGESYHYLSGGYNSLVSGYNQLPEDITGEKCRLEFPMIIENSLIWREIIAVPYTQWFSIIDLEI